MKKASFTHQNIVSLWNKIPSVKRHTVLRGNSTNAEAILVRGEQISVISAISLQGILALQIVRDAVDADVYYTFVYKYLLSKLTPFDGQNEH